MRSGVRAMLWLAGAGALIGLVLVLLFRFDEPRAAMVDAPPDESPEPVARPDREPPILPEPVRSPPAPPPLDPEQAIAEAVRTAVRPGESAPRGMVDAANIRQAIESVRPLVHECFEDAVTRYPPPQKVVLRFTLTRVADAGHLDDGEIVASTVADPWVRSCILDSLLDARFPPPSEGGEVTVTWPFHFSAAASTDAGMR